MKEITAKELNINPITAIAEEWMLITAGTEAGYNTMTASWGHIGSIWGRRSFGLGTSVCYVRPQRYTKEFIDREEYYTLTFLIWTFPACLLDLKIAMMKKLKKYSIN